MRRVICHHLSFVITVLCAGALLRAHGAGFGLYEASARGNSMGGSLVGATGDASANYYNPANMTALEGTHLMAGVTLIHPVLDVTTNGDKNNLDSGWFYPPHVYASQQLLDRWFIGFGLYSEFGLGTKYDRDWPLKWSSTETWLDTLTLNPNVAYKVTDRLSLAAGFRAMYLDFENRKTPYDNTTLAVLPPPYSLPVLGSMRTRVQGDSWGYGYNLAASYKLTDQLDLGFAYRSRVQQTVKGDIEVESVSAPIGNLLPEGTASARGSIELPPSWIAGLNYRPVEKLNLGAAAIFTQWSTYDSLDMRFGRTRNKQIPNSSDKKNWSNVWRLSLGAEYLLTEKWSAQCGYVYDMDPIDKENTDTLLPPGDRHITSFGLGYALEAWKFYGGYGLIIMEPVDRRVGGQRVDFDDGFCHLISFSVATNF